MKKITAYLSPESWKNFLETLGTVDRDGQSMSLIDYFYKQQATAVAEETPTPAQQAPAPHVEDAATNEPPLKKARKVPYIEDSTTQGEQNEGSKGEKCEQCLSDTPPNQDRKREQREFFFFWRLLNDKSHEVRNQSLEQVRIKNKAQTREGPTRVLKGLSAANRRPAECAEIEETIKCAGGTSSWKNFKTRAVQTTAGALCADCWFDFCNQK